MDIGGFSQLVMSGCGAISNFPPKILLCGFVVIFMIKKLRLRGRDPLERSAAVFCEEPRSGCLKFVLAGVDEGSGPG